METQRITPEQVVEAYRKVGYSPARSKWINRDRKSCCGLTAVALEKGFNPEFVHSGRDLAQFLGLPYNDYVLEFADGFDGTHREFDYISAGYEDGQAVWEAVKRELI